MVNSTTFTFTFTVPTPGAKNKDSAVAANQSSATVKLEVPVSIAGKKRKRDKEDDPVAEKRCKILDFEAYLLGDKSVIEYFLAGGVPRLPIELYKQQHEKVGSKPVDLAKTVKTVKQKGSPSGVNRTQNGANKTTDVDTKSARAADPAAKIENGEINEVDKEQKVSDTGQGENNEPAKTNVWSQIADKADRLVAKPLTPPGHSIRKRKRSDERFEDQNTENEETWLKKAKAGISDVQDVAVEPLKKPKGFLDLPGEVRNMIYKNCFTVKPDDIRIHSYTWGMTPNLLRTCRQVYEEAKTFPYENDFVTIKMNPTLLEDLPSETPMAQRANRATNLSRKPYWPDTQVEMDLRMSSGDLDSVTLLMTTEHMPFIYNVLNRVDYRQRTMTAIFKTKGGDTSRWMPIYEGLKNTRFPTAFVTHVDPGVGYKPSTADEIIEEEPEGINNMMLDLQRAMVDPYDISYVKKHTKYLESIADGFKDVNTRLEMNALTATFDFIGGALAKADDPFYAFDQDPQGLRECFDLKVAITERIARRALENGAPGMAVKMINVFRNEFTYAYSDRRTVLNDQQVHALYGLLGDAYVQQGRFNDAIFCFIERIIGATPVNEMDAAVKDLAKYFKGLHDMGADVTRAQTYIRRLEQHVGPMKARKVKGYTREKILSMYHGLTYVLNMEEAYWLRKSYKNTILPTIDSLGRTMPDHDRTTFEQRIAQQPAVNNNWPLSRDFY